MNLNVLSRSFSTMVRNQKAHWLGGPVGRHQALNSGKPQKHRVQPPVRLGNPGPGDGRPKLRVEDIKVSADDKYMYCKGRVRSQGSGYKPKVVVAVEWLDKDRKALNTDWKRIELDNADDSVTLLPDAMQPFIVQAALDRRVKWVKAYAFSGNR